MWNCTLEALDGGRVTRYAPLRDGSPLSYRDALRLWQDEDPFRDFITDLLVCSSFAGFRWETPPVTAATATRAFEFVLIDAPGLDRTPEPEAFGEQFHQGAAAAQVLAFPNLRNDAVLVVPRPLGPDERYVHLAAFVRHAPAGQVRELWRVVGATMGARLSARPVWLSTAGMGVAWLHVRLDSRPKYYGFAPYRQDRGG